MIMGNYKLIQRANPLKKDAPKKWYASPLTNKPLELKAMTRVATENTTTAPIEMEASMEHFVNHTQKQLLQGHTVNVPGFGSFRITFKSEGVENINDFNAGQMIKSPRILFTPAKELRETIKNQMKFENGGVLQDGISYASMADYRKAIGITGGGSTGGGGGSDGGDNENPLG